MVATLSSGKEQKMKTAITIVMILSLAAGLLYGTAFGQQPPPIPAQEQPEVLTRGPVHEAFDEPVILQNQAGIVVPKRPPANIEEIPPAERPEGDHYVWVPGYWSWDEDRNDYIWVSACWRAAPPNMTWVPGYWSQVTEGWEWVAGFWTQADNREMEYLPTPPAAGDEQPPGPPPSPDDIWVPPCQYWYQGQYVLRPGYWLAERPDWVWVPSYYVWTPRGYTFCNGHWDYPLEDRGVLFAPVYFPPSVYGQPGFSYSPSVVVDLGGLMANLFSYPRYCHYYFGDYYDDSYLSFGIFPQFEVERMHTWYDPMYVYDRWHHRQDEPRWEEQQQQEYDLRHTNKDLRPPRTYHEMEIRRTNRLPEQQQNNFRMAEPLTSFAASKQTSLKFEHINSRAQHKLTTQATAVHTFSAKRRHWESTPARQKTVQPPSEQKGPVTTPTEHKGPLTPLAQHEQQVIQPKETQTPFVPPREIHITQPERVKVPAPPLVGRQSSAEKSPPPRPVDEGRYQGEVREAPKENQRRGNTKDKGK
ncbi:MAG: hypothetical protein WCE90_09130 [Candidatus Zixiibacteriota bacterium]